MSRFIGIRHRVKRTAAGEARPTQVAILPDAANGAIGLIDIEDEDSELDFVLGRLPHKMRPVTPGEDLTGFLRRHIKWQTIEKEDGAKIDVPIKVPSAFVGLQAGDTVAMAMGGSGDNLAFALSRQADKVGARVMRIQPFVLKDKRGATGKDDDATLMVNLAKSEPGLFRVVADRDRDLIRVRETFRARQEAMRDRIKCEQRLRQALVGRIYRSEDGLYPEGLIEEQFDEAKASDIILQGMRKFEGRAEKDLFTALDRLPVYTELLSKVRGIGPMISARIIASVPDIRLFPTKPKFRKFCGVCTTQDGRFLRRRTGEVANWSPEIREAFYLAGDQFKFSKDSEWGLKLRENKVRLRQAHPEPVVQDNGKTRYSDGHILKMALWKTRSQFANWLYTEWKKLEGGQGDPVKQDGDEPSATQEETVA